jgi:RNA polymerase primary sigma factor
MATTKKSSSATRRKTTTSGSERATKTTNRSTVRSGGTTQKRRTTSAKRSTSAKRTTSPKQTTPSRASAARNGASRQNGASRNGASRQNGSSGSASDGLATSLKSMGGTVVHGMDRAAKPALAVGATAVGIAGGIALRRRHKSTLPFGLPRNGDGLDIVAISKAVGKASARLGQTAKSVSKDIDTAADRAERIGKILS